MARYWYLVVVLAVSVAAVARSWWGKGRPRRALHASLRTAVALSTQTSGAPPPPLAGNDRTHGNRAGLVSHHLARLASALTPAPEEARTSRRLALAGLDHGSARERYLAARFVSAALVPLVFVWAAVSPLPGLMRLMVLVGSAALLLLGPEAWLSRAVASRQEKVRRDLPALMELLLVSVEAGLGLDPALARVLPSLPGPLGGEISRYLAEVRMGASRREALEGMDRRAGVAELRSFVRALSQAELLGLPIGQMLRSQAAEARTAQMQHAREQAGKAPVKMLFPLVFCVLPALFVVVLGPAGIEIYHMLSKT